MQDKEQATATTELLSECAESFRKDFCPYQGAPDPWIVWQAAWKAAMHASHGQAPAGGQDTIADVRNALADSTPSAFDNSGYREFASTVLDEVEERLTTLAAVAGPSEFLHEQMDVMALARYKVMPSHESMFHRFAVVAGDGAQQLYIGREVDCQNMARKFAGAFLDGAFAYHSMTAAPTTQPAPRQEAQEPSDAVAYLDIGTGGYLDLGTDLANEALSRLPKGRHALVIAGTYGIDGYTAAPTTQPSPAARAVQEKKQ